MGNRKWQFKLLLVLLVWASAEVVGAIGMKIASHHSPFMSYGDYFKIRKNLLGEADAHQLPRYTPTPSLNYIPTPGYSSGGVVQHNQQGYRGPAVSLKKTDAYRILFLGGSTTYGYSVWHPDSTYPAKCGQILDKQLPETRIEIINAGAESATSAEELAYYHFKYRYYQPDMVVLHSGGNDALTGPHEPLYQPDHSHNRNLNFQIPQLKGLSWLLMRSFFWSFVSIKLHYSHLAETDIAMYAHARPDLAKWYEANSIDTMQISNDGFYNNIDLLLGEATRDGAKVLVLPFVVNENHEFSQQNSNYVRRMTEINQTLRELTTKYGATWVPFTFETITNPSSWKDDCHLDDAGELEKAQLVTKYIVDVLNNDVPMNQTN